MRGRIAEVGAVLCVATIVTVAIAAPVLRAPSERMFGMEIVGRHYDPFLVMEQFARARLPLVTMHDAWYTAGHREVPPVLGEFGVETPIKIAVQAAAREWDRRLEGVYVTLVDYLTGTPFEGWAREIQARWWAKTSSPRFVLSPTPKPA